MASQNKISIILVAAGLSSRMGAKNKLLLPIQGKALFLHITDEALGTKASEVILVTGYESEKILTVLGKRKVVIAYNNNYEKGLTSSIQCGIKAAQKDTEGYLICLSDMPYIKTHHINQIFEEFKASNHPQILQPKINQKPSHPILFSSHFRTALLNHSEPNGCKGIIKANQSKLKFITFTEDFSQDIDTPQDYSNLHERD